LLALVFLALDAGKAKEIPSGARVYPEDEKWIRFGMEFSE
jgi:hypothetical protein